MMAALDDELAAGERDELDALLAADDELRAEWRRLSRAREVTESMRLRKPPEEVWDVYWEGVFNRLERSVAWTLISLGAIVVLGWGVWRAAEALLHDTSMPPLIKLALVALAVGGLILGVSVVRERWLLGRRDPYRGIQR
jgi:anti-sigma factor RsiW